MIDWINYDENIFTTIWLKLPIRTTYKMTATSPLDVCVVLFVIVVTCAWKATESKLPSIIKSGSYSHGHINKFWRGLENLNSIHQQLLWIEIPKKLIKPLKNKIHGKMNINHRLHCNCLLVGLFIFVCKLCAYVYTVPTGRIVSALRRILLW